MTKLIVTPIRARKAGKPKPGAPSEIVCTCHATAANRAIGNHFGDCALRISEAVPTAAPISPLDPQLAVENHLAHARAIADLVSVCNAEELFDDTLSWVAHCIIDEIMAAEKILENAPPRSRVAS